MCIQCAMVAMAAIGSAGVLRHQVVARLERIEGDLEAAAPPPPLLVLVIFAALMDHRSPDELEVDWREE